MASETPNSGSEIIESKPSAISDLYERIVSNLEDKGYSEDDIFAVHLALEEAFLNAVTHGNKMDPSKKVRVDYLVGVDKVEIYITDQGHGFNPKTVPDPRLGQNLYKTEGRGLLLISSYMDVVEFNERGNRVRMVRYKEKPDLTGNPS
jgi:serine/threonine-protein kinase RsbW